MATHVQVTQFQDEAYKHILAEMNSKDDLTFRVGDTLDMKASILLAAITLLATQVFYFLDKRQAGLAYYLLLVSAVLLAGATVAAFLELRPRKYIIPIPEKSGIDRAAELKRFYSQHEGVEVETMMAEFTKDQMGWAQSRISTNMDINKTKADWLERSFYLTACAMILNIIALFMRLF